jgi:hypothetical protein
MPRPNLLPGVASAGSPPKVVFQSQRVIVRARRRAIFRDAFDLLLLLSVDWLFLHWPRAHVPGFDRGDSLVVLFAANAILIATLWTARAMPRWRARRVAATWCPSERMRFFRLRA